MSGAEFSHEIRLYNPGASGRHHAGCPGRAACLGAPPVAAQGFGIGARMAWVTREVEADVDPDIDADALRLVGGQIRLLSQRFGFEVCTTGIRGRSSSSIRRSRRLRYRRRFSCAWPAAAFLRSCWAGEGWYRRKIEPIDGPADLSVSTTEFGWHGGGGLEILAGRHFGIHADYRYTFLDFGDDDDDDRGIRRRAASGRAASGAPRVDVDSRSHLFFRGQILSRPIYLADTGHRRSLSFSEDNRARRRS